ncbi:MAG: hypothetical protein AAFQ57_16395, partial [Cyanobacteria bacterium J06626_14]
ESGSSKIHTIEDIKDIDEYKSTSEVNNESSNKKSGGGKLFGAGGKYSSESSTKNSENLEVINKTDGYRAILFLDIARPFRFPLSLVNWTVSQILAFSPLAQEAKANYYKWEERFDDTADIRDLSKP